MARRRARPDATLEQSLAPACTACAACGRMMWAAWTNRRTLVTLSGLLRLHLAIRRCPHADCPRYHRPYRPEAEGALALPHHEFGLDVIALIGAMRYLQHLSVPEMHRALRERDVDIAERNVTYLLERYDELLALSLTDAERLREITAREGRVILALDGLQPEVVRGYCAAVRSALTDDGPPPLSASGLQLNGRLSEIRDSLERVEKRGLYRSRSRS